MTDKNKYTFNISLNVLNLLGRDLYRKFVTVLGEAISNSWDADAKNVWIYIDREKSELLIKDDGYGMAEDDFRNKFLKVGYSKRGFDGKLTKSPKGRPYIGRKGIGKLALLSCAKKVSLISKTSKSEYVGGTIDNSDLDEAISEDSITYDLETVDDKVFEPYIKNHSKGTIIFFEDIHEDIKKSEEYLRKILALYFRFSLIDKSFHIFLNDKEISEKDLKSLAEKTQFLWNINTLEDPYISQELTQLKKSDVFVLDKLNVKGFIASVEKPRYLKIVNTEEKVGIDLFVNGRLRERDILRHMSNYSTRIVASYLYGQIHFDDLDGVGDDNFTTSRESIKEGNEKFENLLNQLREKILEKTSNIWDKWRLEEKEEGDDENPRKSKKERRARSLYNLSSQDYQAPTQNKEINGWINELQPDAEFNIPSYVDCFLSENLVRKYIEKNNIQPVGGTETKIQNRTDSEHRKKRVANLSIEIRHQNNGLFFLDMEDLVGMADSPRDGYPDTLLTDEKQFTPIRNAVMHTARLTDEAKRKLISVFDNIKSRVRNLLVNRGDNS